MQCVFPAKSGWASIHFELTLVFESGKTALDGIFGSGENRRIAAWRCVKVTDRSEEVEEDGTIIQRERERFTNELTLVFGSGKTALLR